MNRMADIIADTNRSSMRMRRVQAERHYKKQKQEQNHKTGTNKNQLNR